MGYMVFTEEELHKKYDRILPNKFKKSTELLVDTLRVKLNVHVGRIGKLYYFSKE